MILAIQDGRKTQTRRLVRKAGCQCGDWIPEEMDRVSVPEGFQMAGHSGRWWCKTCTSDQDAVRCPYGVPGDQLWVRETHAWIDRHIDHTDREDPVCVGFKADGACYRFESNPTLIPMENMEGFGNFKWRSSLFMPRWASRITLEVTAVRVERLQEISELDAKAEGAPDQGGIEVSSMRHLVNHRGGFKWLWNSINGKRAPWESNPFVWVVEFKRIRP
jgi:hypothetical protein